MPKRNYQIHNLWLGFCAPVLGKFETVHGYFVSDTFAYTIIILGM